MSKFIIFLLGAILGLIIGGAVVFYSFVGAPRASQLPGEPIKAPDQSGVPAGTATVVLNQQFFDTILSTIFRDMNAPAFPLNLTGQNNYAETIKPQYASFALQGECEGKIALKPEGSGVTTGVRLENEKISAPLAFSGSTSVFGQCINFAGWAQANLSLRFDESEQNVYGQIDVETVNLDGVSPIVGGFVTPLVQSSLNSRVNPITILRGQQLALNLPIAASDGTLVAKVKDVRSEVKDNAVNLYITYDFAGTKEIK
jgi:hypothetical protein